MHVSKHVSGGVCILGRLGSDSSAAAAQALAGVLEMSALRCQSLC